MTNMIASQGTGDALLTMASLSAAAADKIADTTGAAPVDLGTGESKTSAADATPLDLFGFDGSDDEDEDEGIRFSRRQQSFEIVPERLQTL